MSAHETGWKLYSMLTVTGEIGSPIDPVSLSWSIELNKIEEVTLTVKKKDFFKREKHWYAPWSAGILLTYTNHLGEEKPWVAGPIFDYGTETKTDIQLKAAGIRKVFENRVIWDDLSYRDMTYGDIAWAIIKHSMDRTGGGLPIVHGVESENGRFERTYERWNLANNGVDKRLTELSEVIAGPDMMFRPVWVDSDHKMIRWEFVHGTQLSPLIPQDRLPDIDTTATESDVAEMSITTSGAAIRHRVWCTGSGEGEGIACGYAEDLSGVEQWQPFLEMVMSDADQSEKSKLEGKAQGVLDGVSQMVDQLNIKLDGGSTKNPVGSFHVGDRSMVTLEDWQSIPDGSREMTIIKMSGDLTNMVSIDFQEDSW